MFFLGFFYTKTKIATQMSGNLHIYRLVFTLLLLYEECRESVNTLKTSVPVFVDIHIMSPFQELRIGSLDTGSFFRIVEPHGDDEGEWSMALFRHMYLFASSHIFDIDASKEIFDFHTFFNSNVS